MDSRYDELEACIQTHRRILNNFKPYDYTPLQYDEEGQIRQTRLAVILPGSPRDAIHIMLHAVPFPRSQGRTVTPLYEAVSYVWGPTEPKSQITIDNDEQPCSFNVTPNLFELLIYLRHDKLPRIMWIDALCINQNDMIEKSQQVRRMDDIYKNAIHTVAWLGANSTPRLTERDMEVFELIGARVYFDKTTEIFHLRHSCNKHNFQSFACEISQCQNWRDTVVNITSRPYFSRMWIRQEFALSRKLTIQIGLLGISGDRIRLGLRYLARGVIEMPLTFSPAIEDFTRMPVGLMEYLPYLLHYGTNSDCYDPRDRIWAFLGLIKPEIAKRHDIIPDYSKSVREVYINTASSCIKAYHNTHILNFCSSKEEKFPNKYNLPSWTPDWTDKQIPKQFPPGYANAYGFAADESDIDDESLNIEWLSLSRISTCYNYDMSPECTGLEFAHLIRRLYIDIRREFNSEEYSVEQLYGVLKAGNLKKFVHPRPHPNNEDPLGETFLIPVFQRLLQALEEELFSISQETSFVSLHREFSSNLLNRRVFSTSRREIGLGPRASCEADLVGICTSNMQPLVLRKLDKEQHYKVVGPCYIDSIMWGEALLGEFDPQFEPVNHRLPEGNAKIFRKKSNDEIENLDPRVAKILGNEWEEFDGNKWQGMEEWYRAMHRRAFEKRNLQFERIKLV